MDGAKNFIQAQAVFHGQNEFSQEVSRVAADDGDAEELICSGLGQRPSASHGLPSRRWRGQGPQGYSG